MLYTTYFSKMNKLPKDVIKIIVTRFPPKWIDIDKLENTYLVKDLSPYQDILLQYKQDNNFDNYSDKFRRQMDNDDHMKMYLNRILKGLKEGKNFALICYEKDYLHCHRSLLSKWFKNEGIEVKEL